MNGNEWLEANRAAIDGVVTSEIEEARLAHRLIPEIRVPGEARTVTIDQFDYEQGTVDDQRPIPIELHHQRVTIPKLQIDDADPARALVAVRRAAQQLARQHDERVFRKELADQIEDAESREDPQFQRLVPITSVNGSIGEGVVPAVAAAIQQLDDEGYRTGYAMIASSTIWTELHRRGAGSATLPATAVRALMDDGPIHRSSRLEDGDALVLSLGEGRIDRVVAEAPGLAFVDQDADERTFDLFERFVPRFRERKSAVLLRLRRVGAKRGEVGEEGSAE